MRSLSDKELVASAAWPRFGRPFGHPFVIITRRLKAGQRSHEGL